MIQLQTHGGTPVEVKTFVFSGGELQIRLSDEIIRLVGNSRSLVIVAQLRSAHDVLELLLVTDALRRVDPQVSLHLVCPYLPYARQDRVCAPGEALSLKVMADLINAQRYETVTIWDPHSDVAPALIDRCIVVDQTKFLRRAGVDTDTILVAPDAGAAKKAMTAAKALDRDFILASKSRDPRTGQITGTTVHSDHVGESDFLIVDDICDGGRTFIELAKQLQDLTWGKLRLYVTHGIFSAGFDELEKHFDKVFVANPFPSSLPPFVVNVGEP